MFCTVLGRDANRPWMRKLFIHSSLGRLDFAGAKQCLSSHFKDPRKRDLTKEKSESRRRLESVEPLRITIPGAPVRP